MKEKLYRGILRPDGTSETVEFSSEDYAQYEKDRIEYETKILPQRVREERDALLVGSDWTQAKDVPDSVSAAWANYRQALRDVPQQAGFPTNVTWPQKP